MDLLGEKRLVELNMYRDVKNYSCMFEISCLCAARQLDQPMHSQSTNFGKFKLHSLNLTGIILHDSVVCLPHGKNQLTSASGRFPPYVYTSSSIQKIKCLKENDSFFNRWCKNMGSQLKRCDALHFGRARKNMLAILGTSHHCT